MLHISFRKHLCILWLCPSIRRAKQVFIVKKPCIQRSHNRIIIRIPDFHWKVHNNEHIPCIEQRRVKKKSPMIFWQIYHPCRIWHANKWLTNVIDDLVNSNQHIFNKFRTKIPNDEIPRRKLTSVPYFQILFVLINIPKTSTSTLL